MRKSYANEVAVLIRCGATRGLLNPILQWAWEEFEKYKPSACGEDFGYFKGLNSD